MIISGPGWAENSQLGQFTFHHKDFVILPSLFCSKGWKAGRNTVTASRCSTAWRASAEMSMGAGPESAGTEHPRAADGTETSTPQSGPRGFHAVQFTDLPNPSSKSSLSTENTTCILHVPPYCCCKPSSLLTDGDGPAGLTKDTEDQSEHSTWRI